MEHPENNEKQTDQKSKVKFKIVSLKVKEGIEYVPELVTACLIHHITVLVSSLNDTSLSRCKICTSMLLFFLALASARVRNLLTME